MFDYIEDTPLTIDGKKHTIRFADGMTGIGTRKFWIDGGEYPYNAWAYSDDLRIGNHYFYVMKWRDTPWDKVYLIIHENYLGELLNKSQEWRKPKKINL